MQMNVGGTANAQNDYRDPSATSSSSQADIFARQLQSRLLSALSSQLVDAIFGENPQESGTISFGGQTIDFVRGLEEVTINIFLNFRKFLTSVLRKDFIKTLLQKETFAKCNLLIANLPLGAARWLVNHNTAMRQCKALPFCSSRK